MNIAAVTAEIHRKLDALGLSNRYNNWGAISNDLSFRNINNMEINDGHMSYRINYTSKRFMIVAWLLFGGKLRIKR